jgi:hypothetical protein
MPPHPPTAATSGRSLGQRIAGAPPWLVLALAWLALLIYAFPGQMTRDSWDHLIEARKNVFTDGHPPAINLLFQWADYVIAGPFLMFVLQSVAFLLGLYLLLRRTFAPRGAAWATLGCYLYPPVMLPMAVIWKDSLMAGFLALGLAALFSQRRAVRMLGLGAMFVATAMRYNAFGATLPLIVLLFEWRPNLAPLKRYAIAVVAWLAVTFAAFGVNRAVTDQPMHFWQSSLAVYDIAGTLNYVDGEYSDAELEQLFVGTGLEIHRDIHKTLRALYRPSNFLPIVNDATRAPWRMPISGFVPAPEPIRDAITRAWWDVVTAHPVAYAKHRLAVAGEVLSFGNSRVAGAVLPRDVAHLHTYANELGQGTGGSSLQHRWTRLMRWVWRHTPIYIPWLYVAISLLLLPLARRHRDVVALLLSGLVLESSLIVLAQSTDYRYSHWMVITTCLAVIVLTARRARGAPAGVSSAPG